MSQSFKIFPNGRPIDENCQKCGAYRECDSPRMEGSGPDNPDYLFVGEAPGFEEDETGEAFQGRAGKLLRKAIRKAGIDISKCRFTNTVRCFVSPVVKILTPIGYKKLCDLKVGEKVLTHKGRFRRILEKVHNPKGVKERIYKIEVQLPNNSKMHVTVTKDHLFKSLAGWVGVSKARVGTKIFILSEKCAECGTFFIRKPKNSLPFCSKTCHNRFVAKKASRSGAISRALKLSYRNGIRDSFKVTEKAHKENRKLAKFGKLTLQNLSKSEIKKRSKLQAKAKEKLAHSKKYVWVGFGERKAHKLLKNAGIACIPQFALGKYNYDFKVKNFLIEILGPGSLNGNKRVFKKIEKKKIFAQARGYKILYVKYNEVNGIVNLIKNDSHEFNFEEVKIISIKKKWWTRGSWSLYVEDDHSYVAHGFVNHNCRPPGNNIKYFPNAVECCTPNLLREIHSIRPKIVVLLGAVAVKAVLKRTGITKLHGEVFDAGAWKYIVCLHPAYILRNDTIPMNKKFQEVFRTARLLGEGKTAKTQKKRNHILVKDHKTLQEVYDILKKQKYLATDIEGSTLSPFNKNIAPSLGCVGWAWSSNDACCLPIDARVGMEFKIKVPKEEFLEVIKEIHEDPNIKHFLHFGKYDYVYEAVLHNIWIGGKERQGYYADTGQMLYCLDERKGGRGLKEWAYTLGMAGYELKKRQWELSHPECDAGKGGNANNIPISILGPYNMDDNIATWRLFWKKRKELKEKKLWERPFLFPQMWHYWTAAILQINGLKISKKRNRELDELWAKRLEKADKKLYSFPEVKKLKKTHEREILKDLYDRVSSYKRPVPNVKDKVLELFQNMKEEKKELNLNSADSKRTLVYDIIGYEPIAYTASTKYKDDDEKVPSTEKWVFEDLLELQGSNKVLKTIVERSALESSHSKYIKPIPDWIQSDGRTHSDYSPHGQLTGRVSSKEPNHENLPKHGPLAKELRSQFVSSGPDYFIMEQDSKQVEMRLFADRAHDLVMIKEFNDGKDPHAMGAMAGFELSEKQWLKLPEDKRKQLRTDAKSAVSFGLLYGRAAAALAADFKKSLRWAEEFIERYFGKYWRCKEYILEQEDYIRKHKITYSYFFRPRRLPDVDSDIDSVVAEAIRQGINARIQSDASDLTWCALHRMASWFKKFKMKSKVIGAVHDAAYIDTYYKEADDIAFKLRKYMIDREFVERKTGWMCSVPLEVDCTLGKDLGNMIELQRTSDKQSFVIPPEFTEAV